jgi:hypothetical protein
LPRKEFVVQLRPDLHRIDWLRDLGAAAAIVVLPFLIVSFTNGSALLHAVFVMAVMSFMAGYWLAPRDLWAAWLGAFLLIWAIFGIWDRMGAFGEGDPEEIPAWFVGVMILVPMIPASLIPLWAGRLLKRDNLRIAARRKAGVQTGEKASLSSLDRRAS